ncbi:hypothetical protein U8V72_24665 [Priestia filamentosa]|uniref:hypothetical protein n=1 Tax=Priestia filamentosa TaxID=1402861 RepID=UPI0039791B6F
MNKISKQEVKIVYNGLKQIAGVVYNEETNSFELRNGYDVADPEVVRILIKGLENYLETITPERVKLNKYLDYLNIVEGMAGGDYAYIQRKQKVIWEELCAKYRGLPEGADKLMNEDELLMHKKYLKYLVYWKWEEEQIDKMIAKVKKALNLFKAGKNFEEIAKETGLSREQVEDCIKSAGLGTKNKIE